VEDLASSILELLGSPELRETRAREARRLLGERPMEEGLRGPVNRLIGKVCEGTVFE